MVEEKSKEREEERFVRETFYEHFGVQLQKIPESSSSGEKTADFELIFQAQRFGVIEVKKLIRTPRTPENGWTVIYRENGIREARRKDNSPQRVARLIQTAWKQLSSYPEPKILTIVNDESIADVDDLTEAFNGFLEYGNEDSGYHDNTASWKIANGYIKEIKWKIDLYIWIDRIHNQPPVFRVVSDEGHRIARLCFGCSDLSTPAI